MFEKIDIIIIILLNKLSIFPWEQWQNKYRVVWHYVVLIKNAPDLTLEFETVLDDLVDKRQLTALTHQLPWSARVSVARQGPARCPSDFLWVQLLFRAEERWIAHAEVVHSVCVKHTFQHCVFLYRTNCTTIYTTSNNEKTRHLLDINLKSTYWAMSFLFSCNPKVLFI